MRRQLVIKPLPYSLGRGLLLCLLFATDLGRPNGEETPRALALDVGNMMPPQVGLHSKALLSAHYQVAAAAKVGALSLKARLAFSRLGCRR